MAKLQNARFEFRDDALFSGALIDRSRPISFKLEGQTYQGFEGDSILSALLACGVDTAGELNGEEIALDAELSPPVIVASSNEKNTTVLPMGRTPLVPGMELRIFTPEDRVQKINRSPLERITRAVSGRGARSLDLDLTGNDVLSGPWADMRLERDLKTDLVVVGSGVSGLSAALAAAECGWAVTIVEQRSILGGDARFFGSQEGEQRPEKVVKSLEDALASHNNIQIFTNSRALSLSANGIRVHRVVRRDDEVHGEVLRISGRKTILATGTLERLPVFPGNRLPGVAKARASFHLSALYGVWSGQRAAFCTSSSAATQVALLAADMGIKIAKLADSRSQPRSRFFEFAKAYGISLATGTQAVLAQSCKGGQLDVRFGLTSDSSIRDTEMLQVDRLIVCGGWQPDLTLWHGAGGLSFWSAQSNQLQGAGTLNHAALAGSSAGEKSMSACANHGRTVFFDLAGLEYQGEKLVIPVSDHESDDDQLPVVRDREELESCFLDSGSSFAHPALKPKGGLLKQLWGRRTREDLTKSRATGILTLNEVAAKVVLGEIPAEYSGIIAQERCIHAGRFADGAGVRPEDKTTPDLVPCYLRGRFGDRGRVVKLIISDDRSLEEGCQIYMDTEANIPSAAVGVVLNSARTRQGEVLAYLDMSVISAGQMVVVRNTTHVDTVEVAETGPEEIQ